MNQQKSVFGGGIKKLDPFFISKMFSILEKFDDNILFSHPLQQMLDASLFNFVNKRELTS